MKPYTMLIIDNTMEEALQTKACFEANCDQFDIHAVALSQLSEIDIYDVYIIELFMPERHICHQVMKAIKEKQPHAIFGITMNKENYRLDDTPCRIHTSFHKYEYEKEIPIAVDIFLYRLFYYRNSIQVFDKTGSAHSLPLYRIAKIKPYRKGLRITTARDKKTYTCTMAIDDFMKAYQKDYSFNRVRYKLYIHMRYFQKYKEESDRLIIDGEDIPISIFYWKDFRDNKVYAKYVHSYV